MPEALLRLERDTGSAMDRSAAQLDSGATVSPGLPDADSGGELRLDKERLSRNVGVSANSALVELSPTDQRRELRKIDASTRAELAKPVLERRLQPLLERYRAIAAQGDATISRTSGRAQHDISISKPATR